MHEVILILLVINCLAALAGIYFSCVTKQGVEVNHILTFSIGFLFYWIAPIAIGTFHFYDTDPAMKLWYAIWNGIYEPKIAAYLSICLGAYVSFWLGHDVIKRKYFNRPLPYRPLYFHPSLLNIPLIFGVALAGILAALLRDQFFHGYAIALAQAADMRRGTFVAAGVFLLSLALIYTAKNDELRQGRLPFHRLILNRFFLVYLIVSFLILSLGGRLYFVAGIVMLLVYRTVYFRRIKIWNALILSLVGVLLAGLLGLTRLHTDLSLDHILMNISVESVFTSFSMIHFLRDNALEALKFPVFLLSNFIDLIPTPLFPDKLNFMLDPNDYGYVVFSPGGALNSFFSMMINFGVVGTFIALFLLGSFLAYLRYRDKTLLFRVVYVMLTGWLDSTFFRDPFFISIVKSMFQFSIVTPVITVGAIQILSYWLRDTGVMQSIGQTIPADGTVTDARSR